MTDDIDALRSAYDEVYVYTMERPPFILQHVVDAFAVQSAKEDGPIGLVFGLVGLYLHVERQFSGRQVQEVHKKMGRTKRQWPKIYIPQNRGRVTAIDVLCVPAGPQRDKKIDDWCQSVWAAFCDNRQTVISLLREYGID